MHALLDDLLDLARLESGRVGVTFGRVDLHNLARSVIDENLALATRRGITVALSPRKCSMDVRVDAMKIKQVLRNLLVNAIKFSPDNSEIEIDMRRDAEEMVVAVADRGVGIPEEELEAIFDKFIQSNKTRTGAGGTGLGAGDLSGDHLRASRQDLGENPAGRRRRGHVSYPDATAGPRCAASRRLPPMRPPGEDGPSTILETADAGSI